MMFSTLTLAWLAMTVGGTSPTATVTADSGTVLLSGLKTLREARNEFGPSTLDTFAANNRLFKNTAYGHDGYRLMLIEIPRIIINEEEEERATGLRDGAAP